ncbi:MAG: virulence factor [bacterium]|nr:virulence factor [bacterium]
MPPRDDPEAGRRRRRRGSGDGLIVISWRDIPAQVNAGSGDDKVQRILPRRFQRAIDNAAMVAGKSEASQYIGEWRRTSRPADGDGPEAAALRVAAELEAAFPADRLAAFAATGGWDPDRAEHPDSDGAPAQHQQDQQLEGQQEDGRQEEGEQGEDVA